MEPLSTPDVTPIQKIVGAVGGVLIASMGVVEAFDFYEITGEQSAAILGFWTAISGVLVIADAVIRNGRARAFTNYPKGAVLAQDSERPPSA